MFEFREKVSFVTFLCGKTIPLPGWPVVQLDGMKDTDEDPEDYKRCQY